MKFHHVLYTFACVQHFKRSRCGEIWVSRDVDTRVYSDVAESDFVFQNTSDSNRDLTNGNNGKSPVRPHVLLTKYDIAILSIAKKTGVNSTSSTH